MARARCAAPGRQPGPAERQPVEQPEQRRETEHGQHHRHRGGEERQQDQADRAPTQVFAQQAGGDGGHERGLPCLRLVPSAQRRLGAGRHS